MLVRARKLEKLRRSLMFVRQSEWYTRDNSFLLVSGDTRTTTRESSRAIIVTILRCNYKGPFPHPTGHPYPKHATVVSIVFSIIPI